MPTLPTSLRRVWKQILVVVFMLGGILWTVLGLPGFHPRHPETLDRSRIVLAILFYGGGLLLIPWTPILWRRWRAEILLALVSLGVGFLAVEIAIRLFIPVVDLEPFHGISSSRFHHLYPPDVEMYAGTTDGRMVIVETNEDGLRADYAREEFLLHSERMAVLGDSFILGPGVRQENVMPSLLEGLLRQDPGPLDFAVLNAGIMSYSPLLERNLYERVLTGYHPQRVLLFVDPSDIGDDANYSQDVVTRDGPPVFDVPDEEQSEAPGFMMGRVLGPFLFAPLGVPIDLLQGRLPRKATGAKYDYYQFELSINGTLETNRFFIYRHPLEKTRPWFEATWKHIEQLANRVAVDGATFTLFILPRFQHWNAKECPNNWEDKFYAREEPWQFEYFRFFEEKAGEAGFPVVNLLPDFQATTEFPLVFDEDPHWNEHGHAFAAKVVAKWIKENGKGNGVK